MSPLCFREPSGSLFLPVRGWSKHRRGRSAIRDELAPAGSVIALSRDHFSDNAHCRNHLERRLKRWRVPGDRLGPAEKISQSQAPAVFLVNLLRQGAQIDFNTTNL